MVLSFWLPATLAMPVAVENQNRDEPIHISARSVTANQKTGVEIYTGSVIVEQGGLSIKADRVEIRTHNNRPDFMLATGNPVTLRQQPQAGEEEIQAQASQVEYHVDDKKLDMLGDVTLHRGKDLFTGHVLHYDLNTNGLSAAGGDSKDGRVHAVIQPVPHTVTAPAKP
ncbi:MAG: lipopolysaccharide transport periplasmic protein LptA [Sulfuricaulis sp.]